MRSPLALNICIVYNSPMPKILIGTCGYDYDDWRVTFYPHDIGEKEYLYYYAGQFPTVEINNSYYMPTADKMRVLLAAEAPDLTFSVRANERFTRKANADIFVAAGAEYPKRPRTEHTEKQGSRREYKILPPHCPRAPVRCSSSLFAHRAARRGLDHFSNVIIQSGPSPCDIISKRPHGRLSWRASPLRRAGSICMTSVASIPTN